MKVMKTRWEIQHYTICEGWVNVLHENDDKLVTFDTKREADADLAQFIDDMETEGMLVDKNEWRVVKCDNDRLVS